MVANPPSAPSIERSKAMPGAAPRQEYIDGLRALAALWVVAHHTIETSEPKALMTVPLLGPIVASLFFGQFPVMIFLMLSGFCLYYPYVKRNREPGFELDVPVYLMRRFRRIAPPYYAAGAFCLVLAAIPALQIGRWETVGTMSSSVILTHFLFLHNLIPSHATKIDYPMWSIGLEFQLYLVFPFLLWTFRRTKPAYVLTATLVVAAVIRGTYLRMNPALGAVLHDGPFSYLEIFALGMLAAAFTVDRRDIAPRWVLGLAALAGFGLVRLGSGNGLAHDLETSVAAFSVLMLARDPESAVARTLSTPWLARIGLFSYSVYLVHAPLLHLSWFALRPFGLSPDLTFAVLILGCMPLWIFVSYGFHVAFVHSVLDTSDWFAGAWRMVVKQ
jgi:peptidoglycan/LPS O-acetylase OafA/YrhL